MHMKTQMMRIGQVLLTVVSISFALNGQNFGMRDFNTGRIVTVQNYGEATQAFLRQADINYQNFDMEATFFSLENAVAQNPQSADALLRRATYKQRIGMETEAAQDFRLANRLNPYAADLYGYNGTHSILNILAYEPEEALSEISWPTKMQYYHEWLNEYFLADETDLDEWNLIEAVLLQAEEENIDEAKFLLDSLLESFPKSGVAYDLKGLFLSKEGDYEEAQKAFSKAVSLYPNYAIGWYNYGQTERINGNFKKAKEHLDKAIELQPNLMKSYFDRALVLKSLGYREAALEDYNKIIKVGNVDMPEAYLNRGLTRKMLGDFGGALADMNAALESSPNDPVLHKNRGNLYLLLGYHQHAIEDYTNATLLDENFAEAYYNRALAHLLIYNTTAACFDLETSIELGYNRAADVRKYFCVD